MCGWGYYAIYDNVRSNKQAEAVYFPHLRRLIVMTLGEEHYDETSIIDVPDNADTAKAIGKLLKERFKTGYVSFHPFQEGEWIT